MIDIYDDVLADPLAYRAAALAQNFASVAIGPITFHGIAPAPDRQLRDWLTIAMPDLGDVTTFLRRSPAGQVEPHYIHDDRSMGSWTAILYLTPDPPEGDGTTFWRYLPTGAVSSTAVAGSAEWLAEAEGWFDTTRWEVAAEVGAKFNRLVKFPAHYFHSRSLFENYGAGDADARLIQVCFGGAPCLLQ